MAFPKKILPFICLLIPLALSATWYFARPFSNALLVQKASLQSLTSVQKHNIALAAQRLNGTVLEPGETFSFNRVVGPRNARRGYQAAPSYIADASPKTLGGGVCLLSSTLYQLALKAGFHITERVAHLRPIKTVEPGFDAAIWYGQVDVAFENNLTQPLQILAVVHNNQLQLTLSGKQPLPSYTLRRNVQNTSKGPYVLVFRNLSSEPRRMERISIDQYGQ